MTSGLWRGPLAWITLGCVLILVFSWISWTLSSDLTEERVRGDVTAAYHDGYAEDLIDRACLALVDKALRACIHAQIGTARDHSRAERDLDAQVLGYLMPVDIRAQFSTHQSDAGIDRHFKISSELRISETRHATVSVLRVLLDSKWGMRAGPILNLAILVQMKPAV